MGRVNIPELSSTDTDRLSLDHGFKTGTSHCFRIRCHMVLLKAEDRISKDVGLITGMSHISVNHWIKHFKLEGIPGLINKPGQGRKPVLNSEDKVGLLEAVKSHRQRLQTAKVEWESSRYKSISYSTLHRFFKVLTEDINV